MKKITVLLALFIGMFAFANTNTVNNTQKNYSLEIGPYNYMQPLKFIERGVEFFVFPNGEFDFNSHPRHRRRRGRGIHVNISYGAPRSFQSTYYLTSHHNQGVRVEHDHLGRVRRVGNVFINYDRHSRIKRIGTVYMNYHHNLLVNIGGLHLYYSRNGRIHRTTGTIKHNLGCHYCGVNNCATNHYGGHHNNHNNHNDYEYDNHGNNTNDDDLYYYRNGNKKTKKNKR